MSGATITLAGSWRLRCFDAVTGSLLRERTYRNTICGNGANFLASWLNLENPSHTATTIYGAVGTGAAAPTAGDTQLGAELARVVLATSSRLGNVVTLDFFFNTSQGNGAWAEAGLFLGASAAAGSGQLLSHVAVSETKTSSITATLEFSIQIGG